jgi:type II secretory pathway pseudopilin PulG
MKGRSSLFLIEQLVVIAVFAVCAAVCVKIISTAYAMTNDAVDTRNALAVAESAAEQFKAHGGIENTFFNENWQPASEGSAFFILQITERVENTRVNFAEINVTRLIDNAELIRFTAARRAR